MFESSEDIIKYLREHFEWDSFYNLCMVAEDIAQYGLAKGLALNGLEA